jgi:hypothetical protein
MRFEVIDPKSFNNVFAGYLDAFALSKNPFALSQTSERSVE